MSFLDSSSCHYALFCFSILVLLIVPCKAAALYCNTSTRFTDGSALEQNRNTLVNSLVHHAASSGGYNATVYGQSTDWLYGLLQCRGDLTVEECYACSLQLNSTVRRYCSRGLSVVVICNNKCYLRYEPFNFIGILDNSTEMYDINGGNATNPAAFSSAVKNLFSDLYAAGSTSEYSQVTKIYALLQCMRDIFGENCKACLRRGIGALLNSTEGGNRLGAAGSFGSCSVLYEVARFSSLLPLLPSPSYHQHSFRLH